jgi:hypothetical protein
MLAVLLSGRRVACYNAAFDARLLAQTAARYGLAPLDALEVQWDCAMVAYSWFVGEWSRERRDFRWHRLTDTYPRAKPYRTLILYDLRSGRRTDIGRFYSPPEITGEIRCDLHPRWSRDGRQVCFDSAHEGHRQVHAADVSRVVGTSG